MSLTFIPANLSNYVAVSRTVTINVAEIINALVRVAYVLPTNRVAQPHAVEDLRHAIHLYQDWFREQMTKNGFGPKTFKMETEADGVTPKIHVIQVAQTDSALRGDLWGQRVIEAATAAGIPLGTPGEIWWMVPETHLEDADGSISGTFDFAYSYGGSGKDPGWALLGSDYLARCGYLTNNTPYDGLIVPEVGPYPLRHEVSFPWFDGSTLSSVSSSALGAGLRGIAEALGLDHDFRNDENFNGNLMGFGFRGIRGVVYPKLYPFNYTRLSFGAAMALNVSPYFNFGRALSDYAKPRVTIVTSGASTPANGMLRISFSTSDPGGLSAASFVEPRFGSRADRRNGSLRNQFCRNIQHALS